MSLKPVAQAVQNQGRGPDTMLVHMSPNEVRGLQQLAVANGGSLTTNPETGLPEAGFLDSILPTVLGIGLAATGIGAPMAGLIVGGIQTARTGDLGKGLMAGLGAYGGAGLGAAASSAGQAAGAQAAQLTPQQIAQQTAQSQNVSSMARNLTPMETAIYNADKGSMITGGFSPVTYEAAAASPLQSAMAAGSGAGAYTAPTTTMGRLAEMGRGVGALGTETARTAAMESLKGTTLGAIGTPLAAAAGPRFPTADRDPRDSSEFLYFEDTNPFPGFYPTNPMQPGDENYSSGFAAQYGPQNLYQQAVDLSGEPQFAGIPVSLATNPDRMREYQANPNLYRFAEGGDIRMAPEGYIAGQRPEFDYGFRPMDPTQVAPVEAIRQAGLAELAGVPIARGVNPAMAGGDNQGGGFEGSYDMGYTPGIAASFGRSYHQNPMLHAIMPGGVIGGKMADNYMQERGQVYSPTFRDYENEDVTAGGSEGYENLGVSINETGRGNVNEDDPSETFFRAGGKTMDDGGFVIDAHTVSEIGNGSSDAGHERLAKLGGEPIEGPGDGVSDSIKANIGGVQEARIARDESYLSRDDVKALGGGDIKKGEKMLYTLMRKAHESRKNKGRGEATGLDKLIARMG